MLNSIDAFHVVTETDEERAAMKEAGYIAGLQHEREGYVQRGFDEGVAAVDAELTRLGVTRETPRGTERAVRAPSEKRGGKDHA